eukprot:Clim_evm30s34 gene=Clim_evmTU30s34
MAAKEALGGGVEDRYVSGDATVVDMTQHGLEEFPDLVNGPCVRQLFLDHNNITRFSRLHLLKNLVELHLPSNRLISLEGLLALPKLQVLNLQGNSLLSTEGIDQLSNLRHLNLSHNGLQQVVDLSKLVKLSVLQLSHNYLHDLPQCSSMVRLERLHLGHNSLTSLEDTSRALPPSLQWLSIETNPLADITQLYFLSYLPDLQVVNIEGTPMIADCLDLALDYRPFVAYWCPKLEYLDGLPSETSVEEGQIISHWPIKIGDHDKTLNLMKQHFTTINTASGVSDDGQEHPIEAHQRLNRVRKDMQRDMADWNSRLGELLSWETTPQPHLRSVASEISRVPDHESEQQNHPMSAQPAVPGAPMVPSVSHNNSTFITEMLDINASEDNHQFASDVQVHNGSSASTGLPAESEFVLYGDHLFRSLSPVRGASGPAASDPHYLYTASNPEGAGDTATGGRQARPQTAPLDVSSGHHTVLPALPQVPQRSASPPSGVVVAVADANDAVVEHWRLQCNQLSNENTELLETNRSLREEVARLQATLLAGDVESDGPVGDQRLQHENATLRADSERMERALESVGRRLVELNSVKEKTTAELVRVRERCAELVRSEMRLNDRVTDLQRRLDQEIHRNAQLTSPKVKDGSAAAGAAAVSGSPMAAMNISASGQSPAIDRPKGITSAMTTGAKEEPLEQLAESGDQTALMHLILQMNHKLKTMETISSSTAQVASSDDGGSSVEVASSPPRIGVALPGQVSTPDLQRVEEAREQSPVRLPRTQSTSPTRPSRTSSSSPPPSIDPSLPKECQA